MDSPARVGRLRLRLADRLSLGAKIAWVLAALAFAPTAAMSPPPSAFWTVLQVVACIGFLAMGASWWLSMSAGEKREHVWFGDGVLQSKRMSIAAADITSALALHDVVEIGTRTDRWIVTMEKVEDAQKLVEELGHVPGGKPVTYAFAGRYRRFLHLLVGFLAYQTGVVIGALLGMVLALAIPSLSWVVLPSLVVGFVVAFVGLKRLFEAPVVTVGNDGVWIASSGWKKRFVPITDIVMAHQPAVGASIRLKLRDGSVVPLGGFLIDARKRDAAAVHIRALLAKHAELQKSSLTLAREGRTVREWREHLRQIVEGSGYRVAGTSDSLVDRVGAPGITPEERVGAALALRVSDKDAIARIRIAAEQCVDPKTRIALEAAAQEEIDDAAIEKALR